MKKALSIIFFLMPFLAFGQTNTQGTTPHTLIWNKGSLKVDSLIDASGYLKLPFQDTATNQGTITVLPADSFIYVREKGAWHKLDLDLSGYVQYTDSNVVFVTPSQLQDSIAANTIDTTSLSNRINQRVKYSDTSSMLLPYLRKSDTASLSSRINSKQDKLNGIGFVKASGTTISYDNSSYTPTSRTLTINGTTQDLSTNRSWSIPATDTTSLSNRINQKQNISDTNTVDATRYWVQQQSYLTTEVDGSTTNELQTLSRSGQNIVLSNSGGSVVDSNNRYLPGTGIGITGSYQNQVISNTGDLSNTNELQNLSNSKTGNSVTVNISSGAGITFSVADGDSSTTNELQTISKSGSTVTLSNSGGSFTDDNTTYTAGVGVQLVGTQFRADTSLLATNNDLNNYVPLSEKAANNGVATLDAGGKVPLSQLPASLMIYKGVWNAGTNTPVLMDGVGTAGWVYKASPGGTVDLGSGPMTFLEGDWAIYNGSTWERSGNTDVVTSVNGQQGDVNLSTTDIPEGTNLYFTNARARNAISVTGSGVYNPTTGVISITNQFQNLGLGTATSTTQPVTITSGTGVTLPSVTTSTAGLMAAADKTKLNGIATGAEVNVQPDWNQTTTTADDYIKNKPSGLPPTGTAGGDLSGTYPNPQVLDNSHNHIIANVTGLQDSLNRRADTNWVDSNFVHILWDTAIASGHVIAIKNGNGNILGTANFYPTNPSVNVPGLLSQADKVKIDGVATGADVSNNGYLSIGTGTGLSGSAIFYANQSTNSAVTIGIGSGYTLPTTTQVSTWNGKQNALGTSTGGKYLYQDQTWKQIQYSEIGSTPPIPAQVNLTGAGATTVTGTYPNLTISSTDNNTTYSAGSGINLSGTTFSATRTTSGTGSFVTDITQTTNGYQVSYGTPPNTTYSAGTGLSLSGTTFANTAPDQTVAFTNGTGISVTGTYPNFTVTNTAPNVAYTLPTASATVLGGIKVGSRLSIASGVLSADDMIQTLSLAGNTLSISGGNSVTLPTVNDATISIKNGTTTLGSFTANQGTASSIDISSAIPATPTLQQVNAAGNTSSIGMFIDRGTTTSLSASLSIAQNGGSITFANVTSTANTFIPKINFTPSGSYNYGGLLNVSGSDAGYGTGAVVIRATNAAGTGPVTGGNLFTVQNYTANKFKVDYDGNVFSSALAGTGTRMVVTDASGNLSAQALRPNGFVKINSNYTVSDTVGIIILYGASSYTLNLPNPATSYGRIIQIFSGFANNGMAVSLNYSIKSYQGNSVFNKTQFDGNDITLSYRITSDGTDWWWTGY